MLKTSIEKEEYAGNNKVLSSIPRWGCQVFVSPHLWHEIHLV